MPPNVVLGAVAVALLIFVGFFGLYTARRLGVLLALDPIYLAGCAVVLVDVFPRHPIAAVVIGFLFGVVPLICLSAMLSDCLWGLFASDVFYLGFFGIFGQLPLAPAVGILLLVDRSLGAG